MNSLSVEYFGDIINKALNSTDIYRRYMADRQEHTFTLSRKVLIKQSANAFGVTESDSNYNDIKAPCNKFFNSLSTIFKANSRKGQFSVDITKSTRSIFSVTVTGPNEGSNVYRWIFTKLAKPKAELYKALVGKYGEVTSKRNFLDISHEGGTQIGRNASKLVIQEIENIFKARPSIDKTHVDKFVLEVKTNLANIYNKAPVSRVTYKSYIINRGVEAKEDKKYYEKTQEVITKSLRKVLEPSVFHKVEQDVLIKLSKDLQGQKNVLMNGFKYYDIKEAADNIIKTARKTNRSSSHVDTVTNSLASSNPVNLKVIMMYINSVLPGQIASNMGSPKLNYRTGRFAQSAHVTDILPPSKGHNVNINYSYMIYPYATFEPGGKQGSPFRDPKLIIGESIREIAEKVIRAKFDVTRIK